MPQFPPWMNQQAQMPELQQTYRQAARGFNTQPVEQNYQAQMAGNIARGRSATNSMVRGAESRAFQTGGRVAASFAGGDAMLGAMQQNRQMLGDLEDYKLRARTVEPVFGQLKACQKLSMMSRRGLAACESEWLLACTARNLRKLHRHRIEG